MKRLHRRRQRPEWNTNIRSNVAMGNELRKWETEALGSVVSRVLGELLSDKVLDNGKAQKAEKSSGVRTRKHS